MGDRIILLNGPSSSGKSTLAKALQDHFRKKASEQFEIVSIDDFLRMTTKDVIYEDDVFAISEELCTKVHERMAVSPGVIIDHVITSERIFRMLEGSMKPYRMYKVRVTCPPGILRKREEERGNRCPGSAEASAEYLYPKDGYDLSVDTHYMTQQECACSIFDLVSGDSDTD